MGIFKVPEVTTGQRMTKTFAKREIVCDTDNNTFYTGDGTTLGGIPIGANVVGAGSIWHSGAGVPSNALGVNNDWYLDTNNSNAYERVAGVYVLRTNIKGATGAAGASGAPGANGQGVPTGGAAKKVLVKNSGTDFDTKWDDPIISSRDTVRAIISSLASNSVLKRFNNAMARGRGGNAEGGKIAFIGDSTDVLGFTGGIPQGWPSRFANQLHSSGVCNASFESVYAASGVAYSDSRMTYGASFSNDATVISIGGETRKATTPTTPDIFRPSVHVDKARLQYRTQPGGGVISLAWRTVGGGSDLGIASISTDGAIGTAFLDLNIGSLQLCELQIRQVSGGQVNWIYLEAWDSARQPVRFLAMARGGYGSADWANDSTASSHLPAMLAHNPDLVVLGSLVNDGGDTNLDPSEWAAKVATSETNIRKIINAIRALPNPPDIILRTQNPQNPLTNTGPRRAVAYQDMFVDMIRSLAVEYGFILLDTYANVGSYAEASTYPSNFFIDDWVHLNSTGTSTIANQAMIPIMLLTGMGNGYAPQAMFNSVNVSLDYKLRNSTILRSPAGGCLAAGVNAQPTGAGVWNTTFGDNGNNNGGGFGNDVSGYDALSAAGFKLNNTIRGKDCGKGLLAASNNNLSGNGVCSTVATNINRCLVHGTSSYVTTPSSSSADFINFEDSVKGYSPRASNGGLTIQGAESLIGVLKGASLQTANVDLVIPCPFIGVDLNITGTSGQNVSVTSSTGVVPGMMLNQGNNFSVIQSVTNATTIVVANTIAWANGAASAGLRYRPTSIFATNASADLSASAAAGGVYTAPAKGGTALVAASQNYTTLSSRTKTRDMTLTAAALADTFAGQNLYWNLTTGHGSTVTADIYVYGKII